MKILAISILATCVALLTAVSSQAQQVEKVEKRISLLAIGNPPQPRYLIRGDRRHLLDNAATEHPPAEVMVREKRGGKESFKGVPLGLNSPTGYITYHGERELVLFREDSGKDRLEFARLTLPDLTSDLAIFLLRNRKTKSWESEPDVHYFDNGLTAFPNDSVRLVNLSTIPVRTQINDGRFFQLEVGRSTVVRIPRQDQGVLTYRIAVLVDDKIHPLIDTSNTTMPDTRFNIIVYNSDSADSRMVVDVASYFERPPLKNPE
ncbi:MAG: hypothetical protein WEB53_08625 [Akkermansiaceae bacterium]